MDSDEASRIRIEFFPTVLEVLDVEVVESHAFNFVLISESLDNNSDEQVKENLTDYNLESDKVDNSSDLASTAIDMPSIFLNCVIVDIFLALVHNAI